MFNTKRRIKELELEKANLHSHIEYFQSIMREKNKEVDRLKTENIKLTTFIADKLVKACDRSEL